MDFKKIRNHNGSQNNGFEELVCQLAHLQTNNAYDKFIRIDGAGGDGGIECYWQLKDGSIHGWQAKYFIGNFNSSQLNQLSKSVTSALKNYPKLTTYYICLPRNRTPRQEEKLNNKIQEWTKNAINKNIKFEYWGETEILEMLQIDNPKFSGRLMYWFNKACLTQEKLQEIADQSKQSLGERYTPEFHVDLPIVKRFDAIVSNDSFWNNIKQQINEVEIQFSNIKNIFSRHGSKTPLKPEISEHLKQLQLISDETINKLNLICNNKDLSGIDDGIKLIQKKHSLYENIKSKIEKAVEYDKTLERGFYNIPSILYSFLDKFQSKNIEIAKNQAVLLLGDAGVGKSHLLCDVVLKRLENKQPALFLLGQHYSGGNPLDFIKRQLDLAQQSDGQVLGALDALGETSNNKTLIMIDAVNEGNHRGNWNNHIINFVSEIKKYPNIAIVLSCRTTYKNYILPANNGLAEIYHHGFSGFEHKAAEQYLSKQGISKPNTPILLPEFSNPLFLKTCCKAIKNSGQTNFPRGMHGIEALFNFYVESIEKVIARTKHYRDGENIVAKALQHFADKIYPESIFGIPLSKARTVIESKDSKPNTGESLFDLLINEGVLAEDIDCSTQEQVPVIRFTYERFSDYFIVKSLLSNVTDKNIDTIFTKQPLMELVNSNRVDRPIGILIMLGIQIAEKFNKELIDLVTKPKTNEYYQFSIMREHTFNEVFLNILMQRSKNSFTEKTLKLLDKMPKYDYQWKKYDILLSLSTEQDHPWNADFLHKNLIKLTMAKRDSFWSIHIATNDYIEDENSPESPLRSLIEWAHSANLDNAEKEQIRLCTIVLMWMTSTSNNKVRDQATKSLIRMLSIHPDLLLNLLEQFYKVNDPYIVERLYAVAYGVVVNVDDKDIIYQVATFVYDKLFKNNQPTPHILIRDYGNSILEFALYKNLLNSDFVEENFRPPYKSSWSTKYISEQEIKALCGEHSSIEWSVMGYPGDFGKYTMSGIHNWSPTPITEAHPETPHELQLKFANTLNNPFKDKLIQALNKPSTGLGNVKRMQEAFKQEIKQLSEEEQENFRWVMGLYGKCGAFSRKFAQRWVCKRAHELGWSKELFQDFEKSNYFAIGYDWTHNGRRIERIGKKYQWIALYELLAYLADNYHYIDPDYEDADNSQYYGPWQFYKRNIDPTHWLRNTASDKWDKWQDNCWWNPFIYTFANLENEIKNWLWSEKVIPPFKELLQVTDNKQQKWCVLHGYSYFVKEIENFPDQVAWHLISHCIVSKKDTRKLKQHFKNKILYLRDLINIYGDNSNYFLKEYPWHNSCKDMVGWDENRSFTQHGLEVEYLMPVVEYSYNKSEKDGCDDISVYLPSKKLINALGLSDNLKQFAQWQDSSGEVIFKDPSVYEKGPSAALVKTDVLLKWLNDNKLQLIWFVTGEKSAFHKTRSISGRLDYSGIYELSDNGVIGNMWFKKEQLNN